jgi:hypothetical protein
MNSEITIQMLLRQAHREPLSPEQWKRVAARTAWVRETIEKWYQAMRHRDEVCTAAVERLSEEEFDRLFDREEAKVEALRAEIDAVIERDEWPLEMYFGGI